jgi:hypothetical protein
MLVKIFTNIFIGLKIVLYFIYKIVVINVKRMKERKLNEKLFSMLSKIIKLCKDVRKKFDTN